MPSFGFSTLIPPDTKKLPSPDFSYGAVKFITFSIRAFETDYLLYSSIIIKVLSLPVKKMKGIWQARTTRNIILKVNDSQFFFSSPTFWSTFSVIIDPKKNTPNIAIAKYRNAVKLMAIVQALIQFLLVCSLRLLYIGNKFC